MNIVRPFLLLTFLPPVGMTLVLWVIFSIAGYGYDWTFMGIAACVALAGGLMGAITDYVEQRDHRLHMERIALNVSRVFPPN